MTFCSKNHGDLPTFPRPSVSTDGTALVIILAVFALLVGCATGAYAQNPCQLGFRSGSPPTIDGAIDVQNEWDDASQLTSDDRCLGELPQDVKQKSGGVKPTGGERVEVYTKRAGQNLYIGIEVTDKRGSAIQLPYGERIIVQFDPSRNAGSSLQAHNRRIDLGHTWGGGFTTEEFYRGKAPSSSNCQCNYGCWDPQSQFPNAISRSLSVSGNSYSIEMEVPLSAVNITSSTSPFRLSVAILNDVGRRINNKNWSTATGVPDHLPLSNRQINNNGLFLLKCVTKKNKTNDWKTPSKWAVGYFQGPTPALYLSQTPKWWNSSSITAHPCDAMTQSPGYEYNTAGSPCELDVKADLERSSNFSQRTVHLLYLWGEHGAGVTDWKFIALNKKTVTANNGPFTSGPHDFGGNPPNLNGHPCVRVYILPGSLEPGFDRSQIENISSLSDIQALENTYSVNTSKHRAQENLSTKSDRDGCQYGCTIAGIAPPAGEGTGTIAEGSLSAETKAAGAAQSLSISLHEKEGASVPWGIFAGIAGWWFYLGAFLLAAIFVLALARRAVSWSGAAVFIFAMMVLVACGALDEIVAVDQSGTVHLSEREMDRYRDSHVLVQTEVGGSVPAPNRADSALHIAQRVGGAIDLIPVEMLRQEGTVPITLTVGNPSENPMSLGLETTVKVPTTLERTGVVGFTTPSLEEGNVFEPGESREVTAQLIYQQTTPAEELEQEREPEQ